ncbi:MAG: hypothetical protein SPI14_05345 [Arcanobacterium sp.]|nr:hypothetical protein [Arcanobacterium sp.]
MAIFGAVWIPEARRTAGSKSSSAGIEGELLSSINGSGYRFDEVVQSVSEHTARPIVMRVGLIGFFAEAAVRHAGGLDACAENIMEQITEDVGCEAHIGFADTFFAATLAAYEDRSIDHGLNFVRQHRIFSFLEGCFTDEVRQLVIPMLENLDAIGIHTIGDFLSIDRSKTVSRFGKAAVLCYAMVDGRDLILPRQDDKGEHAAVSRDFPEGIEQESQITFVGKEMAQELIDKVAKGGYTARLLGIRAGFDDGDERYREWSITAIGITDIANRVRWQIRTWADQSHRVRLVDFLEISAHELYPAGKGALGLWGNKSKEKEYSENSVLKIQAIVGEKAVYVPRYHGGQIPGDVFDLIEWQKKEIVESAPQRPWPGAIPQPWPPSLCPDVQCIEITDCWGHECYVTSLGRFVCSYNCEEVFPAHVIVHENKIRITNWAGPWLYSPSWWQFFSRINPSIYKDRGNDRKSYSQREAKNGSKSDDSKRKAYSPELENTYAHALKGAWEGNKQKNAWDPRALCEISLENNTALLCIRENHQWAIVGEY